MPNQPIEERTALEAIGTQLVDRQVRVAGHTHGMWAWDNGLARWVNECVACHCRSYVDSKGRYQGVPLLVACTYLREMLEAGLPLGGIGTGAVE